MNRLKIILATNHTLHEMLIGIGISNILLAVIALIIPGNRIDSVVGVLIGALVSLAYCIHMAVTIDDALCLDEKGASAQVRKHMLIRYLAVCIVVGGACMLGVGNPIFIVLSILTVKLGAYLQPVIHKYLSKWR